jgi:hypothetical protein
MAQVLPGGEDFAAPDWLTTTAGSVLGLPWYFWYLGWKPTNGINTGATDYAVYPYRSGGELETVGRQELYIENGGPLPVVMTDTSSTWPTLQRSVLCREEDSVAVEDIDYKVVFGLTASGGSAMGSSYAGSDGRSPKTGGRYVLPDTDPTDSSDNHQNQTGGPSGDWTSGGSASDLSYGLKPPELWALWNGSSLFFRAGGGNPLIAYNASVGTTSRAWWCTHVSHYAFCAYPVINSGADRVDLYLELWQVKFVNGTASGGTPRRLIQQIVDGGASTLDASKPYFLRVTCDNGVSNVDINAYIGEITVTGSDSLAEAQCFKAGVFPNDTFSVGTDVTHTSSTGNVEDAHADKITAYADKTFGWGMGPERTQDVGPRLNPAGPADPQVASGREGVYSVEIKDISAGTILYRDEFERSVTGGGVPPDVINPIVGLFGAHGNQANGLFTFDAYAHEYQNGGQEIRRLMLWTDAQNDTSAPNDFVTLDYDEEDHPTSGVMFNRMRSFVHERPSTQFFNHHRSIEFKPGTETNNLGAPILYEFGLALRGSFDGRLCNATVAYLQWITDNNNTVTYTRLVIATRNAKYNDQSPWSTAHTTVIASKTWTSSYPALYDGNWHSLGFRAEIYPAATSPQAAAEYHVELDGSPIELDDADEPQQSSTVSPYPVVEPGPTHYYGNQEGFWFYCDKSELDTGGTRNYALTTARNWAEGALTADPISFDVDLQASIVVAGEGAAVGALNTSAGALGITGGGVWEVEVEVTIESSWPIRRTRFDSGHTYTSPASSKARRRWRVIVRAADLSIYQSLQAFYNSHNGMEIPFSFVVPVMDDGTEAGHTAEAAETVVAWFASDALDIREVGPEVYDIGFSVEEELVP